MRNDDLLPEESAVTQRPEQEPYPCDDPVGVENKPGVFYAVDVPLRGGKVEHRDTAQALNAPAIHLSDTP